MHAQDFFALRAHRTADDYAPVKASGAKQRRIEHVGPVGGGHQDDAFIGLESVHFHQQLVQGLLALVCYCRPGGAADGVTALISSIKMMEGGVLLALLEQVAPGWRPRLQTFPRSRNPRWRRTNVSFTGDRPATAGLARSRRSNQQHAFRNASAQLLELLRLAQELMISFSSSFASSTPATSLKVTLARHGEQPGPALAGTTMPCCRRSASAGS